MAPFSDGLFCWAGAIDRDNLNLYFLGDRLLNCKRNTAIVVPFNRLDRKPNVCVIRIRFNFKRQIDSYIILRFVAYFKIISTKHVTK